MPMTPVEPRRTLFAGIPRASPAAAAVFAQTDRPSSPVQAFAMPEFTMTAETFPSDFLTMSRSQMTGAALTTFEVKVPAAVQGTLL